MSGTASTVDSDDNGSIFPLLQDSDRVVVVLGAGASISEMKAWNAALCQPPTDQNFLKRASETCAKAYKEFESEYDAMWEKLPPNVLKYQRMEQVFANTYLRVEQTEGRRKAGRQARVAYDSLVHLLRDTLQETTTVPIPEQHLQLFSELIARTAKVTLVNFNYEVLADRALRQGDLNRKWRWRHTDGYGFTPQNCRVPRILSDILHLKLHGSMNWYTRLPGKKREAAFSPNAPIYIPKPATRGDAPAWQRRQKIRGRKKNIRLFPLLVPPVYEKGSHIHGRIAETWELARRALEEASIVLVWGYSLPITDYHAEILFARSARRARYRLIVVNPNPEALGRVTFVTGHRWNRWFFKIGHFFAAVDQKAIKTTENLSP